MSSDLSTLSACCDIAEQMLLRGFQHLNTHAATMNDLDHATTILTRLTAVRKSIIHLSDRDVVGRVSDPTPQPSAIDHPSDSPSPDSPEDVSPRASSRDDSPGSPSPDRAPAIPQLSVRVIHPTHIIRDIPALPPDRIERVLSRVMADLAIFSWEHPSPEQPVQPLIHERPAEPAQAPDLPSSRDSRSPERPSHPSPHDSPADSARSQTLALDSPVNSS